MLVQQPTMLRLVIPELAKPARLMKIFPALIITGFDILTSSMLTKLFPAFHKIYRLLKYLRVLTLYLSPSELWVLILPHGAFRRLHCFFLDAELVFNILPQQFLH